MSLKSQIKSQIKSLMPDKALMHLQALDHWIEGEPELRLLAQLCDPKRTAVDIGANIGSYAYHCRRHAARVVAYEPNPGLARRLSKLLPDVDVRQLAVSDRAGEVVLQVPVGTDGTEQHELASIAQQFDGQVVEHRVRSVAIDDEAHADVGFIKIDVEQHERAVLMGALGTIRQCRPVVMTEVSPLKYEQGLDATFAFLTVEGYVGWFSFAGRWLPLRDIDPQVHVDPARFGQPDGFMGNNLLFFPTEHPLATTGPKT